MNRNVYLSFPLFMLAVVFETRAAEDTATQPATMLVVGRIWTADSKRPMVEAVAVRGDKIVAVGARRDLEHMRGPKTQVIDAGAGIVVPGLIDSHIHLIDGGLQLASVQLRDAKTPEEFVRRIGDFAQKKARGEWITGGDWDHTLWGGELPSRDWIDAVTPDTPVWLNRLDGHMSVANTAAMRAAKVADDVKEVAGGEIVRDKTGRPTGIFKDNALGLIDRAVPDPSMQQRLDATAAAMDYLAARGVTSVHHLGTWSQLEIFRIAERRGMLKTRIYACTPLGDWKRLAKEVKERGRGDDWLRIGGLKGFVDGSLGSHTAALLEPFSDKPGDRGLLVNTEEDLEKWTKGADKAGLQVAIHAIGDRAIRMQLDVFERVAKADGPRDRRFRIEHSQHIAADDIPRYAKLGVIASMQPYHCIDDGRWAEKEIGAKRSETTYAFRSLLDTGARLAFGSDWFVAPPTPVEGIYAAVTRRTLDGKNPGGWHPDQKLTVEEALHAYTIDAAYAEFAEREKGSLAPGKLADFVVLSEDPFAIAPERLDQIRIDRTVVGGRVVYERVAEP
jgi:predicted amidohydrolase YtcJ